MVAAGFCGATEITLANDPSSLTKLCQRILVKRNEKETSKLHTILWKEGEVSGPTTTSKSLLS